MALLQWPVLAWLQGHSLGSQDTAASGGNSRTAPCKGRGWGLDALELRPLSLASAHAAAGNVQSWSLVPPPGPENSTPPVRRNVWEHATTM